MIGVMRTKEVEQEVVRRKEDFESLIGGMESLTEAIEILSDMGLMEQIRESEKDIGKGNIFEIKSEEELNNLFLEGSRTCSISCGVVK
jgi:CRISPR/Cas system Type II protein with McrA/HNH and RuvC-like nuclease domain